MPFLSVDHHVVAQKYHELYKKITSIGASQDCDIVCDESGIEPVHALITLENHGYEIEPASRKAEVFINGKKIKKKTTY